jgi:hypothetical protein
VSVHAFGQKARHAGGLRPTTGPASSDFSDWECWPAIWKFVEANFSYEDLKHILAIPSTWGAKIRGEQFRERAARFFKEQGAGPTAKERRGKRASHHGDATT